MRRSWTCMSRFVSQRREESCVERRRRNSEGQKIIMLYHLFSLLVFQVRRRRREKREESEKSLLNEIPEDASIQSAWIRDSGIFSLLLLLASDSFSHFFCCLLLPLRSMLLLLFSLGTFWLGLNFVRNRREEAIKRTLTRRGTREGRLYFPFKKHQLLVLFCALLLAAVGPLFFLLSISTSSLFFSDSHEKKRLTHTHSRDSHTHTNIALTIVLEKRKNTAIGGKEKRRWKEREAK